MMTFTYDQIKEFHKLITSLEELTTLREVTVNVEMEDNKVQFPLDLGNGTIYDLNLPKEDFLKILDRNIAEITEALRLQGIGPVNLFKQVLDQYEICHKIITV